MISIGKQYMIFKPKEKINSKGERIVNFSIGNSSFDKATSSWLNKGFIFVMTKTNQVLADRDKVVFDKITGLDTSEYNGKQTITIFAQLTGEGQEEKKESENYEAVEKDDLPF